MPFFFGAGCTNWWHTGTDLDTPGWYLPGTEWYNGWGGSPADSHHSGFSGHSKYKMGVISVSLYQQHPPFVAATTFVIILSVITP